MSDKDYDKGYRRCNVEVADADELRPRQLFIGDVITGRIENRDVKRVTCISDEDDDEANESSDEVRYSYEEDYRIKITPGKITTAQVIWGLDEKIKDCFGVIDLSDGNTLYSCDSLSVSKNM